MFLHVDEIVATPSHKDGDIIDITDKESIEITVDVGCTSPGVTFTWNRPENTDSSSKPCPGNPYFRTSKSAFRMENPPKNDDGKITLSITHPTLKSKTYTWNLKCK